MECQPSRKPSADSSMRDSERHGLSDTISTTRANFPNEPERRNLVEDAGIRGSKNREGWGAITTVQHHAKLGFMVGDFKRVSPELAEYVVKYMIELLGKLRLQHWILYLNTDDEPRETDMCSIRTNGTNREFSLWLGEQFIGQENVTDLHRRVALVHECLHLPFERPWGVLTDVIWRELGKQAREMIDKELDRGFEQAIDNMAWAIAEYMPEFIFPDAAR